MLSPRYLSVILAFVIAGVATAFISFLPHSDSATLFVSFISVLIFGSILIYFALDNLVFKKVNVLYDQIKQIKKKNFPLISRKQLVQKENPIELLKKELTAYVSTTEDEVKELKKAAVYRQEFLADVSHELKTPIFAAQGFVHTLLDNPDESPEIRQKFLEKAAKSLDGLDALVKDLLTVSQIETGAIKIEKKRINLRPMIEEIFESRMESHARAKPSCIAVPISFPVLSSSFIRSKMRIFASTAIPIERMNPAIPAANAPAPSAILPNVSTTPPWSSGCLSWLRRHSMTWGAILARASGSSGTGAPVAWLKA